MCIVDNTNNENALALSDMSEAKYGGIKLHHLLSKSDLSKNLNIPPIFNIKNLNLDRI